jgi:hypothetical protein
MFHSFSRNGQAPVTCDVQFPWRNAGVITGGVVTCLLGISAKRSSYSPLLRILLGVIEPLN